MLFNSPFMLYKFCVLIGLVERRSSSLNSATSDDALSENDSSSSALPLPLPPSSSSEYLSNDLPPLPTSTTAKPPSVLPTLFESKAPPSTPASSTGYISTERFDPLMVDSPDDTDSPDAHKLSAQEAAADSGYFPMPSMLDTGTTAPATAATNTSTAQHTAQQKQNGLQSTVMSSTGGTKPEKAEGGGGIVSDYVALPSDLSSSSHSSSVTATSSTSTKSTLASTSAAVAKKSRQLFAKVLPKKSSTTASLSKGSKMKGDTPSQQQSKQQPLPTPPTSVLAPLPSADPSTSELEENDDSDMGDLVDLLDLGDPTDNMGTSYGNNITNGSQSLNPAVPSSLDSGQSSGYYQDTSISRFASTMTVPSTLTSDPFVSGGSTTVPPSTLTCDPFIAGGATPTPAISAVTTVSATNSGYLQSPDSISLADQQGGSNSNTAPPPPVFDPFSEDDDPDSFFLPDLPGDSEITNNSSGGGVGGGGMYSGSIVTLSSGQFPPPK